MSSSYILHRPVSTSPTDHGGSLGQRSAALEPNDGSIAAAQRAYNRQLHKRQARRSLATPEELAGLEADVRKSREALRVHYYDPANAEELDRIPPQNRKFRRHDAQNAAKSEGLDDGSIPASQRQCQLEVTNRQRRRPLSSEQQLAELDATGQASTELVQSRSRNTATAAELASCTTGGLPSARPRQSPGNTSHDDGGIAAAYRAYQRQIRAAWRMRAKGTGDEELSRALLAAQQSLELYKSRLNDPANAEERATLPVSMVPKPRPPRPSNPPPKPDDGSIAAAFKAYERELYKRRGRKSLATSEELAEMDAAVRQSREALRARYHDPANAEELERIPLQDRTFRRRGDDDADAEVKAPAAPTHSHIVSVKR